ncbi:DUF2794 domain-containing protein [Hoeflea poritis]|uniref:DUF2794 domain-containing protein n=1 Tax=Hoeflea poritis TaxID=2993659 RepID=A0ABT4VLD3_9HYPH|nr:DUF2794 domain-containing protein [Hoeflea poritis]MDA4845525.1 DUF2794 domain-containing protein [Hoeflea poritis]
MDGNPGEPESVSASVLVDLKEFRRNKEQLPITFHRRELDAILRLYSCMVAEGEWRDYALDHLKDKAVFSVFRRTSEVPMFRIEKNPKLARKQGAFSVIAASGLIVKRGHDLAQVLKVFDKSPKLVRG